MSCFMHNLNTQNQNIPISAWISIRKPQGYAYVGLKFVEYLSQMFFLEIYLPQTLFNFSFETIAP